MSTKPTTTSSTSEIESAAESRTAEINFDQDGNPLGVVIFLSGDQLQDLGVDSDEETIDYRVEDSEIIISENQ